MPPQTLLCFSLNSLQSIRKFNLDYCRSLLEDETRHVLDLLYGPTLPCLRVPSHLCCMHLHLRLFKRRVFGTETLCKSQLLKVDCYCHFRHCQVLCWATSCCSRRMGISCGDLCDIHRHFKGYEMPMLRWQKSALYGESLLR